MSMSKKLEAALNKQITTELSAAYGYLAMAAWCDMENLGGFAKWFKVQHHEEFEHAMKFYEHVLDRGGKVEFGKLDAPPAKYDSPKDVMKRALVMEQTNTKCITDLYELALKEGDVMAQPMLMWFINEQIEEEKSVSDIIALLEMAGDNKSALLMLNGKLGERAKS